MKRRIIGQTEARTANKAFASDVLTFKLGPESFWDSVSVQVQCSEI